MPTGLNIMFVIKTRDFQLRRKSDKPQPYVTVLHILLIIPMFYINYLPMHALQMHAGYKGIKKVWSEGSTFDKVLFC